MLDDLRQGVSEGQIAARIHHAVVAVSIDICHRLRDEYQLEQVAVSGGVFQNLVLLNALTQELRAAGFEVFTQQQVPCNDGGLSFGQAMIAAALGGVAPWKKRAKRKLLTCV